MLNDAAWHGQPNDLFIRTQWQLANISVLTAASGNHTLNVNSARTFTQEINIDFTDVEAAVGSGIGVNVGELNNSVVTGEFRGTYNGRTIENLKIENVTNGVNNIGLFANVGANGTINNVIMENTTVNAAGSNNVGGLVGQNNGTVGVTMQGTIDITGNNFVGGVVGNNIGGSITAIVNNPVVTGNYDVGGVAGASAAAITATIVNDAIVAGNNRVGGLTGLSSGAITDATVSNPTVDGNDNVGGLAGSSTAAIAGATVNDPEVTGNNNNVGGLAGSSTGAITNATVSNPTVNGNDNVGGLAGLNTNVILGSAVYDPIVTGNIRVGGMVGFSDGGNGNITNAVVINPDVTGAYNSVGGLCGALNTGRVDGIYVSYLENINRTINGVRGVGGIVGVSEGTVTNVTFISPTNMEHVVGDNDYIGGIVGRQIGAVAPNFSNALFLALAPTNDDGDEIYPITGVGSLEGDFVDNGGRNLFYLSGKAVRPATVSSIGNRSDSYNEQTANDVGTPLDTEEMYELGAFATGWTASGANSNIILERGNTVNPYPRPSGVTAAIHPNWPIVEPRNFFDDIFYYEIYRDGTFGVWRIGDDARGLGGGDMPLSHDMQIVEAGYGMGVSKRGYDINNPPTVTVTDAAGGQIRTVTLTAEDPNTGVLRDGANFTYKLPLDWLVRGVTGKVQGGQYLPYHITRTLSQQGANIDTFNEKNVFVLPLYAKGIWSMPTTTIRPQSTEFYIRTQWQLANISALTPQNIDLTANKTYIQEIDIDFAVGGIGVNRAVANPSQAVDVVVDNQTVVIYYLPVTVRNNDGVITSAALNRSVVCGRIDNSSGTFKGTYDGRYVNAAHGIDRISKISNMNIACTTNNVGLFYNINSASTIRNLIIDNANVSGNQNVGAVVGTNAGRVENVIVTNSDIRGSNNTGGVAGSSSGTYGVTNSGVAYSTVRSTANNAVVGGVVGNNSAPLRDVFFLSADAPQVSPVTSSGTNGRAGGIVGNNTYNGVARALYIAPAPRSGNNIHPIVGNGTAAANSYFLSGNRYSLERALDADVNEIVEIWINEPYNYIADANIIGGGTRTSSFGMRLDWINPDPPAVPIFASNVWKQDYYYPVDELTLYPYPTLIGLFGTLRDTALLDGLMTDWPLADDRFRYGQLDRNDPDALDADKNPAWDGFNDWGRVISVGDRPRAAEFVNGNFIDSWRNEQGQPVTAVAGTNVATDLWSGPTHPFMYIDMLSVDGWYTRPIAENYAMGQWIPGACTPPGPWIHRPGSVIPGCANYIRDTWNCTVGQNVGCAAAQVFNPPAVPALSLATEFVVPQQTNRFTIQTSTGQQTVDVISRGFTWPGGVWTVGEQLTVRTVPGGQIHPTITAEFQGFASIGSNSWWIASRNIRLTVAGCAIPPSATVPCPNGHWVPGCGGVLNGIITPANCSTPAAPGHRIAGCGTMHTLGEYGSGHVSSPNFNATTGIPARVSSVTVGTQTITFTEPAHPESLTGDVYRSIGGRWATNVLLNGVPNADVRVWIHGFQAHQWWVQPRIVNVFLQNCSNPAHPQPIITNPCPALATPPGACLGAPACEPPLVAGCPTGCTTEHGHYADTNNYFDSSHPNYLFGGLTNWRMIEFQEPTTSNSENGFMPTDSAGQTGAANVGHANSRRYAELNAMIAGTLYQICPTDPGAEFTYSFHHASNGWSNANGTIPNVPRWSPRYEHPGDMMSFFLSPLPDAADIVVGINPLHTPAQRAQQAATRDAAMILMRPCISPRSVQTGTGANIIRNPAAWNSVNYGQNGISRASSNGRGGGWNLRPMGDPDRNNRFMNRTYDNIPFGAYLYDVWIGSAPISAANNNGGVRLNGYGITFWSMTDFTPDVNGYATFADVPNLIESRIIGYWDVSHGWKHYYGRYEVPAGQLRTEFAFQSNTIRSETHDENNVAFAARDSVGNYLDGLSFNAPALLAIDKYIRKNNANVDFASPGDNDLEVQMFIRNLGESPAGNIVIRDQITPFDEYVEFITTGARGVRVDRVTMDAEGNVTSATPITIPAGNIGWITDSRDNRTLEIELPADVRLAQNETIRVRFGLNVLMDTRTGTNISTLLYYFRNQGEVEYGEANFAAYSKEHNFSRVVEVYITNIELNKTVTNQNGGVPLNGPFEVTLSARAIVDVASLPSTRNGIITDVIPAGFRVVGVISDGSGTPLPIDRYNIVPNADGTTRITIRGVNLTETVRNLTFRYRLSYEGVGYGVSYIDVSRLNRTTSNYIYQHGTRNDLLPFPRPVVGLSAPTRPDVHFFVHGLDRHVLNIGTMAWLDTQKGYDDDNYDITPIVLLTDQHGNPITTTVAGNQVFSIFPDYTVTLDRGTGNIIFVPGINADGKSFTFYYKIELIAEKAGGTPERFDLCSEVTRVSINVLIDEQIVYYEQYYDDTYGVFYGAGDAGNNLSETKAIINSGYGVTSTSGGMHLFGVANPIEVSPNKYLYMYSNRDTVVTDNSLISVGADSVTTLGMFHPNFAKQVYPAGTAATEISGNIAIRTPQQMRNIGAVDSNGLTFTQERDLDFNGVSLEESVVDGVFNGTFNGAGRVITNVIIDADSSNNIGLFSDNRGTIRNVTLENSVIMGGNNVGGIAGLNNTYGTIEDSSVLNIHVEGGDNVGGIAGRNEGTITRCTIDNSPQTVKGNENVGGIAGLNNGTITAPTVRNVRIEGNSNVGVFAGNDDTITGTQENVERWINGTPLDPNAEPDNDEEEPEEESAEDQNQLDALQELLEQAIADAERLLNGDTDEYEADAVRELADAVIYAEMILETPMGMAPANMMMFAVNYREAQMQGALDGLLAAIARLLDSRIEIEEEPDEEPEESPEKPEEPELPIDELHQIIVIAPDGVHVTRKVMEEYWMAETYEPLDAYLAEEGENILVVVELEIKNNVIVTVEDMDGFVLEDIYGALKEFEVSGHGRIEFILTMPNEPIIVWVRDIKDVATSAPDTAPDADWFNGQDTNPQWNTDTNSGYGDGYNGTQTDFDDISSVMDIIQSPSLAIAGLPLLFAQRGQFRLIRFRKRGGKHGEKDNTDA
jgi:hypothetical protein